MRTSGLKAAYYVIGILKEKVRRLLGPIMQITPIMAATKTTRMSLRVGSFNMHGFKIGSSCLADLCNMSDIILVQEHWLSPHSLHLLSGVNDNFVYFASSAMCTKLAEGVLRGRPFGGVGVIVHKSLAKDTSLIVNSERLTIVRIEDLYVVNVYLPDTSTAGRAEIVLDICSQIESHVNFHDNRYVIIGGDFNLEFINGTSCCQDLNSFIIENDLCVCDSKFSNGPGYTHCQETRSCSSWIDHFITSRNLFDKVDDAKIIEIGSNLSDHYPLWIHIADSSGLCRNDCTDFKDTGPKVTRLRWDKADISSYCELTRILFNDIRLDTDVDSDYDKIITALHNASRFCVPKCKTSFFKHYWDDDLSDLKMRSIEANRLWVECGRPRHGYVLQEKCRAKAMYKTALRNK